MKSPRVDNKALLSCGLELMKQNGKELTALSSKGRSMLYRLPNGETVRARTCNDHLLIVVADRPSKDARLNIEGTDWLLIIMPEVERTSGSVIAYLVPSDEAVRAAHQTHNDWLATTPRTKGANTTWNLWFGKDAPDKANDFATKWLKYRLKGDVRTDAAAPIVGHSALPSAVDLKDEVEAARQRIAKAARVSPDAVKITIDFSL